MIRRLEVFVDGQWLGPYSNQWRNERLERALDAAICTMPCPEPVGRWTGVAACFWFTEYGWDNHGENVENALAAFRITYRCISVKCPDEVLYRDEFQVALPDDFDNTCLSA